MSDASIALNRFGLGARAGQEPLGNPKRWLHRQLERYDPAIGHAQPSHAVLQSFDPRTLRLQEGGRAALRAEMRMVGRRYYRDFAVGRVVTAVESEQPFAERLVHFWANHFAISGDGPRLSALAGLFERDAIRPHLLGNFADMLLAVERHPAMLLYLDQASSMGPGSPFASRRRQKRHGFGLNENLAREILELHTLGVDGGYDQADIIEFAKALTGWTVAALAPGPAGRLAAAHGDLGESVFVAQIHEPGARRVMSRRYAAGGEDQARQILLDLAQHPATASRVAFMLARHFAGDPPPLDLVDRLASAFRSGGGALVPVYEALLESPELWRDFPLRFRTPWEWLIAALRALPMRRPLAALHFLNQLGQPVWRPRSPAGFPDVDAFWAGPAGLMGRVEIAHQLVEDHRAAPDPRALAEALFPDALSARTVQIVAGAESRAQGLTLLLVSPEFLRR